MDKEAITNGLKTICEPVRRFGKGSIIYFQGEAPRQAFFIKEGSVRVYAIDDQGEEYIVGFYTQGDIFPLDWLYSHATSAMFYYEAMTQCELAPIERGTFIASTHEIVTRYTLDQFLHASSSSLIRNLALQQPRAKDKIIYFFYFLAIRHGKETAAGLYTLGIPLTHQTIASCLGLTRETVATELGKLKKAGTVAYRNKKYVIDKKRVIKAVGKEITNIES